MKVVSLCPSNTELLAYLGCLDYLVGIDDYSDWPKEVQHLPRLGPDLNINMDAVEELKPDLIIASLSVPGMERNIEELEKRKLPYIVLNPNSLDEIADSLLLLGEALHVKNRAEKVVERYNQTIHTYRQLSYAVKTKPTLYWEWWPKPVFTPGGANWLTEISELAGCVNLFQDHSKASVQSDWEEVRKRNPDHICLAWVGVQTKKVNANIVYKRPQWESMHAVKTQSIHVLEEWLYCRPSPRLLTGLQKLAALIHPNSFPNFEGEDVLLEQIKRF
ncbi:cobalamin-binding protein [Metabacillus iocasae]|uniref:Iron complex transport system substrate-binding protein n=1 Tax=Priestia iocasae TaxID=2291674 RepID=A0ABS2QZ29_9BACI|nr:cobalamin-binding protein [Metabacillus iocasae]MBM7703714.1 iron complex transport system substrate-binding protein [Metabacillus iocasae]